MINLSDIPFHENAKILYENDDFFVMDKPDGVLSHPNLTGDKNDPSIIKAPYDSKGEYYKLGNWKVFLLHRLDRETSGCLLFSTNPSLAPKVKADFESHSIRKEYTALLGGSVRKPGIWKDYLVKKGNKMFPDLRGKPNAITKVTPMQNYQKFHATLTKFSPTTGKTHQLRVQSAFHHAPILGDRLYGNFAKNKDIKTKLNLKRMFLHASKLEFKNPKNQKTISVESLIPEDLQMVIDLLENSK